VDSFTITFIIAPFAALGGVIISLTQSYKPLNIIGWGQLKNQSIYVLFVDNNAAFSSHGSWTWIDVHHTGIDI
jgi:hypothetical protein